MSVEITAARPLHAELGYHVLSHLPLGRDAACLYDPRRPTHRWVEPLLAAYRAAPGRLLLHGLPLYVDDLDQLLRYLEPAALRQLSDRPGRDLVELFAAALCQQVTVVQQRLQRDRDADNVLGAELLPWLREQLAPLRAVLFRGAPPPLRLLHCVSLGPHGRAGEQRGQRTVAVSFANEREQLLCQILHEETHAASDRSLPASRIGERDTAADSAGFVHHRELERRAVALGQELIDQHAPHLRSAYCTWRARCNA